VARSRAPRRVSSMPQFSPLAEYKEIEGEQSCRSYAAAATGKLSEVLMPRARSVY